MRDGEEIELTRTFTVLTPLVARVEKYYSIFCSSTLSLRSILINTSGY